MVGGGYGSKMYLRAINPAAALLAMKVPKRHVRILFDREDEFLSCAGRLPTRTTIKTGVKKDGTLVARQSTIHWEAAGSGASASRRCRGRASSRWTVWHASSA